MYLLRLMSTEEFATIPIFLMLLQLVSMFGAFGLETLCSKALPRLVARGFPGLVSQYVTLTFAVKIATSFTISVAAIVFSRDILEAFSVSPDFSKAFVFMAGAAFAMSLTDFAKLVLKSTGKFAKLSYYTIVTDLSTKGVAIVCFVLFGLEGYWAANVGVALLGLSYLVASERQLAGRTNLERLRRLLRISPPYFFNGIARGLILRGDEAVIGLLSTPELLNSYNIAKRFFAYLKLFFDSFTSPFYVQFLGARSDSGRGPILIRNIIRYGIVIGVMPAFVIAILHKELFFLFSGEKYLEYSTFACWTMVQLSLFICWSATGIAIFARLSSARSFISETFLGVTTVLAFYVLSQVYGAENAVAGPAGAIVIAFLVNLIILGRERQVLAASYTAFLLIAILQITTIVLMLVELNLVGRLVMVTVAITITAWLVWTWWRTQIERGYQLVRERWL